MLSDPAAAPSMDSRHPIPWSCAGGPDPDYSRADRREHLAALTDPGLAARARAVDEHCELDYERMIRVLDLVWDCPDDGAVNVTGYRCSGCGISRALARRARPQPPPPGSADRDSST